MLQGAKEGKMAKETVRPPGHKAARPCCPLCCEDCFETLAWHSCVLGGMPASPNRGDGIPVLSRRYAYAFPQRKRHTRVGQWREYA